MPLGQNLPPMPPGQNQQQQLQVTAQAQAAAIAAATAAVHQQNQQHPQLDLQSAQQIHQQFQHNPHQQNTHAQQQHQHHQQQQHHQPRGGYRGRGGRGGHYNSGPVKEEPLKVHVNNVPEHLNNITKLNEHFAKFGNCTNIQVFREKSMAIVEFQTEAAVHAALNSPEPVLNNRFIQLKQYVTRGGGRGGYRGRGSGRGSVHDRLGGAVKTTPVIEEPEHVKALKKDTQDRITLAKEQIKERQAAKLEGAKKAKVQLLVQQRDLLEKQIAEQKKLVEKLQDANTTATEKPLLLTTSR